MMKGEKEALGGEGQRRSGNYKWQRADGNIEEIKEERTREKCEVYNERIWKEINVRKK